MRVNEIVKVGALSALCTLFSAPHSALADRLQVWSRYAYGTYIQKMLTFLRSTTLADVLVVYRSSDSFEAAMTMGEVGEIIKKMKKTINQRQSV